METNRWLEWYVNLMNFLDERALSGKLLNRMEIKQLNNCIDRYDCGDSVLEVIRATADANDCGICNTWNELILALRKLHQTGERIPINEKQVCH